METKKTQKQLSSVEKLAKRSNELLQLSFENIKFKKGESWFIKFLKLIIHAFGILLFAVLSPLIVALLLVIMLLML